MNETRVLIRAAALVALGAAALTPRARAQSVVVGPLPGSTSAIPGASITLPVVADLTSSGGASLGSVALRLTWRPATLQYQSTGNGALGTPAVNADSAGFGILKVAVANAGGATGMPVLFNATFNVTGAPADTTILGVSVGEITAAGSFADLKPITTATRASFCTSTGLWGHTDLLNPDTTINAGDAQVVLMYAVGLPIAPNGSVVNGDVDGSGVVDTRDALVILSYAVGLPVTQFRVDHVNAGVCSLRSAATVQIQPRTPTVAPGDSLPVTATVKDSTGALVQGLGLVWWSKDSTIARPGAGGSLLAVAPGTTWALVFAQPGVKDSVPVTVTPVRHQWYVNPAVAAANLGVELGSQLYPFASIDTALARAAANDTVHVAVADYGPVRITKPLTVLGDSTAAGFPRLASTTASPQSPALRVDTVPGTVTIQGLRLLNSQKGLVARMVQTLVLGSLSVEGSRDVGLRVYGADSVQLSHVSVAGAVGEGIELDSVRADALDHVRSDGIASLQGGGQPLALKIAQVSTVSGDSITLGTAGAFVDSAGAVAFRRLRVTGPAGPALLVNGSSVSVVASDFSGAMLPSGAELSYTVALNAVSALEGPPQGALRFDSSKVRNNGLWALSLTGGATVSLRADTIAGNYSASSDDASAAIYDFGRLALAQSLFLNNGPGYVDIEGIGGDSVIVDSTVFDGTAAYAYNALAFVMHGGAARNAGVPVLGIEDAGGVEIDSVEVSGNNTSNGYDGAVYVSGGDSVAVNGLNAHDNAGGALEVWYSSVLRVNGGSMLNNASAPPTGNRYTLASEYVPDARVYGLALRDAGDVGILVVPTGNSRVVVDSSALEGSRYLIQDQHCCSPSGDTLIVSRSSLTGFNGTSQYGIDAEYLASLAVTGSFLDSLSGDAVYDYSGDTVAVTHDVIRAWGSYGIEAYFAPLVADSNVFAGCSVYGAAVSAYQPGTTGVVGNAMTGCGSLLWLEGQSTNLGPDVQVLGNTVQSDTSGNPAIYLFDGLGYVQVVGNAITGGTTGGIWVGSSTYNTGYLSDTARVDSNTVRQTLGDGIRVNDVTRGLSLTYNSVADNAGNGLFSYSPFVAEYNSVARNVVGVSDSSFQMSYFRNGNLVGNTQWGAATFNSTLWADSSWWGDVTGPRCVEICNQSSNGDSISGGLVQFTPIDSLGLVNGAPAIPSPPPAPIARRAVAARGVAGPRPPKSPAPALHGAALVAAHAAARQAPPAPPRPVRPTGRSPGRHRPVWKTGVAR